MMKAGVTDIDASTIDTRASCPTPPGDYAAIHLLVFSVLGYSLFGGIDANSCSTSRHTGVPYCSTSAVTGCTDYFSTFQNTAMQM